VRRLHFGCGPNKLPEPWENFDREVNIARQLPFESDCAAFIFAEHVIEHVPFLDGMGFLTACLRVLQPGGVLRFAFPDIERVLQDNSTAHQYLLFLASQRRSAYRAHEPISNAYRGDVARFVFLGSGHRAAWTAPIAQAAALAVGFSSVVPSYYCDSKHRELKGIDGHHKTSPVAELETTVIEATK